MRGKMSMQQETAQRGGGEGFPDHRSKFQVEYTYFPVTLFPTYMYMAEVSSHWLTAGSYLIATRST